MNLRRSIPVLVSILFCLVPIGRPVAAPSKSNEPEATSRSNESEATDPARQLYEQGLQKVQAKDYAGALPLFEKAQKAKKNDPDILNMLAFTQRKTGDLDAAFANYAKALEIKPDFPQAREYLAEAHLQAAMAQMKILRDSGAKAEAALLQDAFAKAAWTVGASTQPAGADTTRRW